MKVTYRCLVHDVRDGEAVVVCHHGHIAKEWFVDVPCLTCWTGLCENARVEEWADA